MDVAEVQAGKYGQHIVGKRYDLLTHAVYWTSLAAAQKKPVCSPDQAAALQVVAREAALATGKLTAEDIEKRAAGITLYPQHVDDDVAFVSVRGMIVVCVKSPEMKSPTVSYFRNWLRQNPRGRAMVNKIAMEDSDVGRLAQRFLFPAEKREGEAAAAAVAAQQRQADAAAYWRAQHPGQVLPGEVMNTAPVAEVVEDGAYEAEQPAPREEATAQADGAFTPHPAAANDNGAAVGLLPQGEKGTAAKKSLLKFNAGGAHQKQLEVTDGKGFALVVMETEKSAPTVLEEYDAQPDFAKLQAEAIEAGLARVYLYQREPNGIEMECVERWPAARR